MQAHTSLQRKFSFGYIAIILAVLLLLNTYPLITSENLTFRSKQSSLQGSVSVMVTALAGLEELSEENVAGAMTLVEESGISRVLVTDASGRVLYDTRETDGAIGRYAFYTELVQALRGEDVFYTEFSDKAFKSRAASPVIYHNQTIGAVYAYEYATEQAALLLRRRAPDGQLGDALPGKARVKIIRAGQHLPLRMRALDGQQRLAVQPVAAGLVESQDGEPVQHVGGHQVPPQVRHLPAKRPVARVRLPADGLRLLRVALPAVPLIRLPVLGRPIGPLHRRPLTSGPPACRSCPASSWPPAA